MKINRAIIPLAATLIAGVLVSGAASLGQSGRAASAASLEPVTRLTEGALQVVDKEGKPVGQCPLRHTSVNADVSGFAARVTVTQEFYNPLKEKIEAIYCFPLPQDAAVDRMRMTVGSRTIEGEVRRREEAKAIYEQAKAAGHVASLLDQERPNIFTQSVANIMPGEKVFIRISYVNLLKYEDGQFEFSFPMVVGPRYIPGQPGAQPAVGTAADTAEVPDASRITPPITPEGTRAGHDIDISVEINAGVPVEDVVSVLHATDVKREADQRIRVSLQDAATIPNKDFILRWQVAGDDVRTGLLPSTRAAGDGYFSLILVPPKVPTPAQIAPKEMIFVIDTSGSQMGWPIEKSKETMRLCIQQMNPNDTFQMLGFSNEVIPLFDKPRPNTGENRKLAEEFLASRLGQGGTEMMKAVEAALKPAADPARLRIVCFMTDGYVGNDMAILDAVRKNIGGARLFSFGIGNGVNRFLLDGMAEMGRGAVEYVTLAEKGDEAASRFAGRIAKPIITDVSVDWGGLQVADIYPEYFPDLFSAKPLILTGRYEAPGRATVTFRGRSGGEEWEQSVPVTLPARASGNTALPSLWGRARIGALTASDYAGIQSGKPDEKIKDQIIQTALDYQLMSQFTSFVAVEQMTVTDGGKPRTISVPVEMPEGVSYDGIFGTRAVLARQSAARGVNHFYSLSYPAASSAGVALGYGGAVAKTGAAEIALGDAVVSKTPAPAEKRKALLAARLDPELAGLLGKLDAKGNYTGKDGLKVTAGRLLVTLALSDDSAANIAKLKALGFEVVSSARSVKLVIGRAPVRKLEEIALLDFVTRVSPVKD
jgi:Ca-activated chloride channel family protein